MVKNSGQVVQAMPLLEGKVNLSAGVHKVTGAIHCVEDGSINVVWRDGVAPVTIDMISGQDYGLVAYITITDGTFHIS